MRPILFIDRDGTIIHETEDEKIETIEKLTFLPDVLYYLRKIQAETDYLLVLVTNQDGLGTPSFPDHEFWPVQEFMMRTLEGERIVFDAVHIDEHYPSDHHPNRKPGTGMLQEYLKGTYDLSRSYVIGDRATDVQLAENLGAQAIYLQSAYSDDSVQAALKTDNWEAVYHFLLP